MTKRFHYFNINGLGESIRYILHYGQVEFEDVRYEHDDKWPEHKAKIPFGQLPYFEDGDKGTINQSLAIARYVGHTLNLNDEDPFKDAQLDAFALTLNDFWSKMNVAFKITNPEEKEAAAKVFLTETLEYYFSRFEKQLKDNNGFFGGKLTWVDFVLVGHIEAANLFIDTHLEANYPTIKALIQKIHNYPGVKKYLASRKPYQLPHKK